MQQVVYVGGNLRAAVGTALQVEKNILDGAAYFVISQPGRTAPYRHP
jgi:hypothetical protein